MAGRLIEAAGGVLWRPAIGGQGVEVGLIHRPKYDDWSLPKGKLNSREHVVIGAIREVWEETGHTALVGQPLGEIRYLKDGSPKRVRFWAMKVTGGEFVPNDEVDQMMWLPPREGQAHLLPERDRSILARFARDPSVTTACVLVRHASAGERSSWQGADRDRPLDDIGVEQAEALVPVLASYGITRVLSADVLRCLETVGPFAQQQRLTVESEPLVSETGYAGHDSAALTRMLSVLASGEPSVVCSQGKTLPDLITRICRAMKVAPPADTSIRKAAMVVLHVARTADGARIAGIDKFDPPPI